MNFRIASRLSAALGTAALLTLAGCATPAMGPTASADLLPTTGNAVTGNAVTGNVQFVQLGTMVRVNGTIKGLKPNAEHGFHIHEKGDCSSGDGMSAGGHFNPNAGVHGHAGEPGVHAGDLPSLHADATGTATFSVELRGVTVGSGPTDVVGRGLIVHAMPDDFVTQPTGNSGGRLACAVIVKR
ncbi:superoxide dismutase family protein [Xylophilus rhododendri]|uniref:Superoxide dismutase [Cu-Zn] n=1 Tax=Xylophilus rhododendri TaxID=2697032 RepID=A0A857IZW9_9BURK|nr:superoxide dismutase family protein [Xylophilus rhododendri]QHI97150.1 superoxide dismutase family protein [Xylophilus rhododendri]